MDQLGPTGKVSKKRVHLLRWTIFPGRTGWNFGWMDRVQEVYNGAGLLETLARLFLLREVKPFPPDNKMIKFLPFVYFGSATTTFSRNPA